MSERPLLEAVLLDAGGTLGRLDFEWMAEAVSALGHPVGPAELRRAEVEGRRRYDASVAPVTGETSPGGVAESPPLGARGDILAYFGGMLAAAGAPERIFAPAIDRFLARQESVGLWRRPMEGAGEALDALAALGLRLAVVSNSDGRAAEHLRLWGSITQVEFVVDSHLVGIEKPDPRIFQIALERLAIPAARTLFVGDIRSVDEVGAQRAGLHFVLIDPLGDYAAPGSPSIGTIAELPDWVQSRFTIRSAGRPDAPAGGRRSIPEKGAVP